MPRLRRVSILAAALAALSATVRADRPPPPPRGAAAASATPAAFSPPVAALSSKSRLRREVVAAFRRNPLDVRALRQRALDNLGMPVPGGPQFVLAVDDDRSLVQTNWNDGIESSGSLQLLAQKYYELAADNVQFIITFTSWSIPNFGAFYVPFANDVKGIGYENQGLSTFDNTGDSPLEGMVLMNSIDTFGVSGFQPRWVFSQELGHRWGSFVRFDDGSGKRSDALLGRDREHWSYFLDTSMSPMEGNHWRDNGDGTFTTVPPPTNPTFMPLDLYLMGLIPPKDVPPLFLIETPMPKMPDGFGGMVDRSSPPEGTRAVTLAGNRRDISVDQVIAIEGPRVPDWQSSPREFHLGFLLVVRDGQRASKTLLESMERRVESDVAAFETATGNRVHLVVESHGINPEYNAPGHACPLGFLQCDPMLSTACVAPAAGGPTTDGGSAIPVCASPCPDTGCPNGGCCLPGIDGTSYCFNRAICGALDAGVNAPSGGSAGGCATAGGRSGTNPGGAAVLALGALLAAVARRRRASAGRPEQGRRRPGQPRRPGRVFSRLHRGNNRVKK